MNILLQVFIPAVMVSKDLLTCPKPFCRFAACVNIQLGRETYKVELVHPLCPAKRQNQRDDR